MNETVTNAATCVTAIVNGPQGKLAIVCGTIVILYGITAACYLIVSGHTITLANSNVKLEAA